MISRMARASRGEPNGASATARAAWNASVTRGSEADFGPPMSSRAEAHDLTGDTPVDSTKSGGFDYSLVARRVEEQPLLVVGKVRFAKRKFGFGKLNSSHLEILSNVSVLDRARASAAVHASINDEDGQRLRLSIYERGGEAALNHSFGSISEVVMEEGGSSKGGAEVAVQQQAQDQESKCTGGGEGRARTIRRKGRWWRKGAHPKTVLSC
ncbi:hypothetical protein CYMTET_19315 [Cymbomonas tetramitiformis]|uniref:Uncharacterized protein n=1 Tax=Cymbomonas tetramitiformis TaxID=36881 RepID=A0AAE0L533_9CHLO|nr:hypothetical protein CYMTET_19315 [Cymbomonas tetramitiformis]